MQILKEHFQYKQQILKLAKADLVKTYRGAALGWSWAVIKPAVTIFVYWFAFSIGLRANKPVNGYDFFLWLIVGIVPWFYMNDMIVHGADSLRKYRYLVTKMKFPIATIPTFVSLSKITVHIILMLIVVRNICPIWAYARPIHVTSLILHGTHVPIFHHLGTIFLINCRHEQRLLKPSEILCNSSFLAIWNFVGC